MKKITEQLKNLANDLMNCEWTKTDKVLLILDCILFGVILGAIWSPKRYKETVIGSYNSGNECDCCGDCDEDEDEEWED